MDVWICCFKRCGQTFVGNANYSDAQDVLDSEKKANIWIEETKKSITDSSPYWLPIAIKMTIH